MLSNAAISFIRTFVPIVVGLIVGWVQPFGIHVDTETAVVLLTSVATAAWYTIARILEKFFPKFGWMLGVPKQPVYAKPPVPEDPVN